MSLLDQIRSARRVSVPLVSIATPDPWATVSAIAVDVIADQMKIEPPAKEDEAPPLAFVEWDFVRGFTARTEAGRVFAAEHEEAKNSPLDALIAAAKLPAGAILFFYLADKWLREPFILQAVWNLRDPFKADGRMLVLLSKSGELPAELTDDVMAFDEPLPDETALAVIVRDQFLAGQLKAPTIESMELATEALRGLSAFGAEQITAISLTSKGLDVNALWERKRRAIEQTPGLKVYRQGDTFEAIGGCETIKGFLKQIVTGQARPNAIVFVDEIEKSLGGAKGDMSGVTQDQLGGLLTYMQDHGAAGMIFIGPPGAAKSAIAKAAGNEAGIPTIQLDLGAAKGSLVGQSEQQLRSALKVITAVSNGKSLWIATCNSIAELPPELRRRFTLGTFFFDLPSREEREAIWAIWLQRYFFNGTDATNGTHKSHPSHKSHDLCLPPDEGWTGAEIKACCDIAWRMGVSLPQASAFIVPVSRSAADMIERLRKQADGRFLSASYPGPFRAERNDPAQSKAPGGRKLKIDH